MDLGCVSIVSAEAQTQMYKHLMKYAAPVWAKNLKNVPKYRVELAAETTPVHDWTLPGVPNEFKVGIKRQDMTGSTLSGNKVEKLEFLLAEAIATGCKHVIMCGFYQSNHCRTASLACRQLGLVPHVFVMANVQEPSQIGCHGNILLTRLSGADMYVIPASDDKEKDVYPKMKMLEDTIL